MTVKVRVRVKALIDTKPLYNIVISQLGIETKIKYGDKLLEYLNTTRLPLSSTWPVFTELMYFLYRDLKDRKDFNMILEKIKELLQKVNEVNINFHDVLRKLLKI